jgi:Transposase DDE domain.
LHLVFNDQRQIIAARLTPGNISDPVPEQELTKDLIGKLFGDRGYIGKKLAQELLRRGPTLITKSKKGMSARDLSSIDQALLDGRSIAETIIAHIKQFSSLRMPRHRSVPNALTHLTAAIVAYQMDPLMPNSHSP